MIFVSVVVTESMLQQEIIFTNSYIITTLEKHRKTDNNPHTNTNNFESFKMPILGSRTP